MRRKNFEVNRLAIDALVVSGYSRCLSLDLLLHESEVVKLSARLMMKFCPLVLPGHTGSCMGNVDLVGLWFVMSFAGYIYKLQNQRSSSDNPTSSRKEVSANYIFQNRGFSRRLGANNDLKRWLI